MPGFSFEPAVWLRRLKGATVSGPGLLGAGRMSRTGSRQIEAQEPRPSLSKKRRIPHARAWGPEPVPCFVSASTNRWRWPPSSARPQLGPCARECDRRCAFLACVSSCMASHQILHVAFRFSHTKLSFRAPAADTGVWMTQIPSALQSCAHLSSACSFPSLVGSGFRSSDSARAQATRRTVRQSPIVVESVRKSAAALLSVWCSFLECPSSGLRGSAAVARGKMRWPALARKDHEQVRLVGEGVRAEESGEARVAPSIESMGIVVRAPAHLTLQRTLLPTIAQTECAAQV